MEDYKEKMELPENIGMTTYASKIILTFQTIQVNLTEKKYQFRKRNWKLQTNYSQFEILLKTSFTKKMV